MNHENTICESVHQIREDEYGTLYSVIAYWPKFKFNVKGELNEGIDLEDYDERNYPIKKMLDLKFLDQARMRSLLLAVGSIEAAISSIEKSLDDLRSEKLGVLAQINDVIQTEGRQAIDDLLKVRANRLTRQP